MSTGNLKKDTYKFQGPWQVEIVARCCRKWLDDDALDTHGIALAEHVIKVNAVPGHPR